MDEATVRRVIRTELETQAAANWPRLSAVPCTFTWRAVDYLRRLPEQKRAALFAVVADAAVSSLDSARDPAEHPGRTGDPEYRQLVDATLGTGQAWDFRYLDARALRGILGGARLRHPRMASRLENLPPEVLARAEQIVPLKAPEIRKLVKGMVQRRFRGKAQRDVGGDWHYTCSLGHAEFFLSIDYGGWDQLRYEVSYHDPCTGFSATRLNYERLMGCGGTGWNFLTTDNASAAIELLGDLVEWLVTLPHQAV
jgi:hypothetical protein